MIKTQVTRKQIQNSYTNIISIPYCNAQYLLNYKHPEHFTYSRAYGWRADVYIIDCDTVIVTGYAPFGNIKPDRDTVKAFEEKAEKLVHNAYNQPFEERQAQLAALLDEFVTTVTGGAN